MPGDTAVEAPVGDNDKKIDEPVTKRKEKNVKRKNIFKKSSRTEVFFSSKGENRQGSDRGGGEGGGGDGGEEG